MPRVTRAALRAQAIGESHYIHEDIETAAEQAPQCFANDENAVRPPLRDISDSNGQVAEIKEPEPTSSRAKISEGRPVGVTAVNNPQPLPPKSKMESPLDHTVEESKSQSERQGTKDCLEAISQSLGTLWSPTTTTEGLPTELPVDLTPFLQQLDDGLCSAQKASKTPKFDLTSYAELDAASANYSSSTKEDSFINSIKTRSPSRHEISAEKGRRDSFTEKIITRSPARHPLGRIEDSVEAMDALNDAIEEIALKIPVLGVRTLASAAKIRSPARAIVKPLSSMPSTSATPTSDKPSPKKSISPLKSAARTLTSGSSKPPAGRISTSKPTGPRLQANRAQINAHAGDSPPVSRLPMSFSGSSAKPHPNIKRKRAVSVILSTGRPGFVPVKSTKPPTKSNFVLPGDAIAAKLKARREERQKREGTIDKDQKLFKARPIPTKTLTGTVPRANKTSQARISLVAFNAGGSDKETITPKKPQHDLSFKARMSGSSAPTTKKNTESAQVNTSIRHTATGPSRSSVNGPRRSLAPTQDVPKPLVGISFGRNSAVAKAEAVEQKARRKEDFSRSKLQMEQVEKERKDREGTAKRARAIAAEKGRLASREWAERQKMKTEAAKKAAVIRDPKSAAVAT